MNAQSNTTPPADQPRNASAGHDGAAGAGEPETSRRFTGGARSGAPVIAIAELHKHYGAVRALDGFDLTTAAGEVHGLLGPNGAGKSTTIRILLGMARPTSGKVRLLGGHPERDAVALHRRLAHVPGDVAWWPNLTGGEAIDALVALRGLPVQRARRDVRRLADAFDLDLRRRCRTYSKGNRQKVALVAAFAGEAELLILDEPTSGLDPLMEHVFQQEVRAARDRGTAVLLSSHILGQVEALVDRVTIMRAGRRLDTGTLDDLRHLTATTLEVTTDRPAVDVLGRLPGVSDVRAPGGAEPGEYRTHARVDAGAVDSVVQALAPLGVRSLVAHPPTLEELLLGYYDEPGRP